VAASVDLNGKTVLVTGGAGFIGARLALRLERQFPGCRVIVFDAFALGHFQNLRGFRGECIAGDIQSADDLRELARLRCDYIFHQAAVSDTTVADQKHVVAVNTNAFCRLLDVAARMEAPVVYASSAAVYGNAPAPHRAGEGEAPENVYGFSKLMMDHAAQRFSAVHGLPIIGLRYFNVYGPGEFYKGTTASMVLQLGLQLLAGRRPKLFEWGDQRRDFVYIDDVVQANLKALAARRSGVYNVGTGHARSFNDLLSILQCELGTAAEPEFIDNPWGFYQNHTEADIVPTQEMLGYQPRYSLEDGVRAYVPEIHRLAQQERPR